MPSPLMTIPCRPCLRSKEYSIHNTVGDTMSAFKIYYFIVIFGVNVLQSICTVLLVHSRTKTSLPGAVSWQSSVGSP